MNESSSFLRWVIGYGATKAPGRNLIRPGAKGSCGSNLVAAPDQAGVGRRRAGLAPRLRLARLGAFRLRTLGLRRGPGLGARFGGPLGLLRARLRLPRLWLPLRLPRLRLGTRLGLRLRALPLNPRLGAGLRLALGLPLRLPLHPGLGRTLGAGFRLADLDGSRPVDR